MSDTLTEVAPAASKKTTSGRFENYFHVKARGSNIPQEIRGGIVTFFSMAYILILNPIILSGPDSMGGYLGGGDSANMPAIAAGTALIAGITSIFMGGYANFPIALAAGLGLNSMVGATIVQLPGMTWADGMGIVVIEGIVVVALVMTGLREAIFRAVPTFLRTAISVGIGLFIALVGLTNSGIVRAGAGTILTFGIDGSISTWPLVVFVFGLLTTVILMVRKVRGSILIGLGASTVAAILVEAIGSLGIASAENPGGWSLSEPRLTTSPVSMPDFSTLGEFSITGPFQKVGVLAVVVLAFSVMLADFFDTMGTMVAVGNEGDLLDAEGSPEGTGKILLADSVAVIAGGMGGVSSNTSFVESSTGVAEGARTGFASIVTGTCFLLATFLAPLVNVVPTEAAAPCLVVVGFLIMQQVANIEWENMRVAIPAFLTIAFMPFSFSITVGIGVGFIAYVVVETAVGKARTVHPLMWIVSALFVIYFSMGPIQAALGL